MVHALRWTSGLAALSAARDLQVPVVQSFDQLGVTERRHGLIPAGAGTERIRLEPAIGRTVNAVVAGSYDEESDLTRLGIPRRSIRVVPTGIDTDEFTPEGPACERGDRHRLVTVADLAAEQEALDILLRAMAKIPGAELVVAGGPPRERARATTCPTVGSPSSATPSTCTAGSSSPARSAGPPSRRCCARPTCWSTSTSTTRPAITSIQAMACGTPVVASAVGGQVDAVVDGTTGILVEPGRPALLAQKIRALLAHPMQLEAFSVAATDRARSRYSWDRIAHETLAVYDTALAA